jgi:hypothetical protein
MDRNLLALHDRLDEEHFDLHLLQSAVRALQQRVNLLEAEVRELRRNAFAAEDERNDQQSNGRRTTRIA